MILTNLTGWLMLATAAWCGFVFGQFTHDLIKDHIKAWRKTQSRTTRTLYRWKR